MYKNSEKGYGLVAITIHWLMAILVFGLFGLGLYMVELSYYDAWYKGSLDLHKSIGAFLAILLLVRIFWRLVNVTPKSADANAKQIEVKAAHYAHISLYFLMALIMVSGYLISTADGRAINIFALVSIPALPFSFDNQEDIFGEIHFYLAWILVFVSMAHALAAMKHHFINRNNTLMRMLKVIQ